jgi:hypothetical protein
MLFTDPIALPVFGLANTTLSDSAFEIEFFSTIILQVIAVAASKPVS